MLITPSSLDAAFVGFQARYEAGILAAKPIHADLADVTSLALEEVNFPIPEGFPAFRAWPEGAPRNWQNLAAHNTKLITGDFELSVKIPRNKFRYDQYGIFGRDFENAGKRSVLVWDQLVFDTILAGETSLCFDGQFFFDTDHPVRPSDADSAVQSNLHTGRALTEANLDLAIGDFLGWKVPDGKEMGVPPNELWVGAPNWASARRITTAEFNAAGATNIYQGTLEVRLIPGLGTSWVVACTDQGVKPVALNKAAEAVMLALTAPTDDGVLNQREYRYAGDCSGAAMLTIPALAHLNKA